MQPRGGHPSVKRMHRGRTSWDACAPSTCLRFYCAMYVRASFCLLRKSFPSCESFAFFFSFANLPRGGVFKNSLTLKIARLSILRRLRYNEIFFDRWRESRLSSFGIDWFPRDQFGLEFFGIFRLEVWNIIFQFLEFILRIFYIFILGEIRIRKTLFLKIYFFVRMHEGPFF